ncbi:efflux transporter outer membrane subunit [Ottowia thiooxydans]|uniref:efflux transporter outer membrane subunit n=1 Tax=Ottowia thiooxydans TaxID=219182 RepID=UPI0004088D73|nr:efflux transporter outer membrane subunit [Ottowia thiooxydans]
MKKSILTMQPAVAAVLATVLLSACNVAPKYEQPPLAVPETLSLGTGTPVVANEASLAFAQAQTWIQAAQLREVVALALSHNRDLRVAIENIEKARAQYGITRADLLPSVNAQAQGSRSRTAADLTTTGRSSLANQFTAQLGFTSYEIDFWGRVRNLNEAALQAFLQSEDNQRNVQIALVADVSNAWLTLAADTSRLQLAKVTLAAREKSYELTKKIFDIGSTSGLVLAQNLSTVETARGDVAAFTSQADRSRNALQLLVGGLVPESLLPTESVLSASNGGAATLLPSPQGLPSNLLLQRPDLQAAEHSLRGMNANIGAARAAMFPTISLTSSLGTGSNELNGLFGGGNSTWSFIPLVRLPIFDGGRSRAGVLVAESNQRIAVAQYDKAVQTAFREVSDVLADRAQWSERLRAQEGMVQATQKAFDLSEARFTSGADNYLTVLDAQRSLYAAQQTLLTLRLAEQINRVTLWKALGGSEAAARS